MMESMCLEKTNGIEILALAINSLHLQRNVQVDIYRSAPTGSTPALLLVNDGQNMAELDLTGILTRREEQAQQQLVVAAIHAGPDRKLEYGTATVPDYLGRGNKASDYTLFVFEELLPAIRKATGIPQFTEKWFAGFSLGALSALDIVWAHPYEFTRVGVFSGALWWRLVDQEDPTYDDHQHRIMHELIRKGEPAPWLKFFFSTGTMDETHDRNNNGIIDSIDDTLDIIAELEKKGYQPDKDIYYLEMKNGRHDIATWAEAMPVFLEWAGQ